jgi:hypothetical protein
VFAQGDLFFLNRDVSGVPVRPEKRLGMVCEEKALRTNGPEGSAPWKAAKLPQGALFRTEISDNYCPTSS